MKIRKPSVAGLFYPASAGRLKDEVQTLLSISYSNQTINNIFGIIVPHAGYIYSGRTAAYAFNLLKNKDIETVVILSRSEEHTSELQSRENLVCRLLLEKKKILFASY